MAQTIEEALESEEDFGPLELYEINNDNLNLRYTSAPTDVTFNGELYSPLEINRNNMKLDQKLKDDTVKLNLPIRNDITDEYVEEHPNITTFVIIKRYQESVDDIITIWNGVVGNVEWDGENAILTTSNIVAQFDEVALTTTYQPGCNHSLYDDHCKVDPDEFSFDGTVTSITGESLTMTNINHLEDDFLRGGKCIFNDEFYRMILRNTGNEITLLHPIDELEVNDQITVFAGCDKSKQTCHDKFDNVINFGGFPYVPVRNLFQFGLEDI